MTVSTYSLSRIKGPWPGTMTAASNSRSLFSTNPLAEEAVGEGHRVDE